MRRVPICMPRSDKMPRQEAEEHYLTGLQSKWELRILTGIVLAVCLLLLYSGKWVVALVILALCVVVLVVQTPGGTFRQDNHD